MALLNFDATLVAPHTALEALPAGWYTGHIVSSEGKETVDCTGFYLEVEYVILEPQDYAGRKLFDRLNLQNKNPLAEEIAAKTLSAICHSTGVLQVQDSEQLHHKPLQIKVGLRPAGVGKDGKNYVASNDVKGYRSCAEGASHAAPVAPPQVPVHAQQWVPAASPLTPAAPPAWVPTAAPVAPQTAQVATPSWVPAAHPQEPASPAWVPTAPAAAPAPAPKAAPPWMKK